MTEESRNGMKYLYDDDDWDDVKSPRSRQRGKEEQCGIFGCRPSWLQPCANIRAFTLTLSLWSLFGSINFSYYTAVITQIEKQFGLPSSVTGFIKNVDNIGYMSTVLIFSHFCRYANKPRLFACATLVSSTAIFIFALPHFIYGTDKALVEAHVNASLKSANQTIQQTEMCDGLSEEDNGQYCHSSGLSNVFNTGALALFIVSEFIQGLGQSPKFALSMTYMDDNAKDKSPKYFAFMFSMRALSPVIGFSLGAWATTVYVDLSDPGISQKDPRWIGAWWLGFVICAICSLAWALPMVFFPPVLRSGQDGKKTVNTNEGEDVVAKLKDLPKALARLFTNKLYMLLILALSFEVYLMGFFTFLPKYLEQYFGLTASMASLFTGVAGAVGYGLGPLVSGYIMTLRKITPFNSLRIVCIITFLSVAGQSILMMLSCPEQQWAGDINPDMPDLRLECNGNCSCDSMSFQPVCGAAINYYSPCHAGCSDEVDVNGTTLYTGCQCIEGGVAEAGVCPKQCETTMYIYVAVLFIAKFISAMDVIPTMTLFMRTVDNRDKALALATVSAILQVMSFPAPIVFGMVIDSACLVLQGACTKSKKGACLLYDEGDFRLKLHGFATIMRGIALIVYLGALFVSRNYQYASQDDDEDQDDDDGRDEKPRELEDRVRHDALDGSEEDVFIARRQAPGTGPSRTSL